MMISQVIQGGGDKSPPKSKYHPLDHLRKIIGFEEAKRRLFKRYHDDSWFHDRSIRNFLRESREKPEKHEAKSDLRYSITGYLMEKLPKELTKQFILSNAEYSLKSSSNQWKIWVWRSIVLLQVSGIWVRKDYAHYFRQFWDVFCERKQAWNKVYFVVDANDMPIQSEEFRNYVKTSWIHLIEREDFCLCIVDSVAMKRAIWNSMYKLLGIQDRIKTFKNHDRALKWLMETKALSEVQKE